MMIAVWFLAIVVGQGTDIDVAALTRLEADWNTAHVQGDAATLTRIFGDDLVVMVPGMRMMTKADSLGMFSAGRMKFDRYESSEPQFRIYGDTAIVTGRIRRTRAVSGKTMDDDWRFTKVYIRREGHWQVVSFHASNVAP